ncbi:MAG: ParB/RepB/Spo0J family partition protein [Actinobacteria bacterium]|nr:ParB/RepB/Spo0J family partition protein [Actinomycetota bacterium]MBW3649913.1 ParB/RepB/Spo0J family partition protein [Actinomycetota bacterium]
MARRSGLGRGLGALIPTEVANEGTAALLELPVAAVTSSNYQPRRHFDEEALASLTASIRELGVLQPILVRPAEEGRYELIAGERRWRAARRAGLQTIPAIVRVATDVASLEQALVENLHRQDLNALEEAAAYQQLIEDFHLTHDEVATRVGKSRSAVSNALRLFGLPPGIQRLVADGQLSAGHARALLGSPDRGFQESLAKKAVSEALSVREVEEAVRRRNELAGQLPGATTARPPSGKQLRPPGLLELEDLLSGYLDTTVRVEMGAKKGRLVIDFATLEDLERIYRAMTEPGSAGA